MQGFGDRWCQAPRRGPIVSSCTGRETLLPTATASPIDQPYDPDRHATASSGISVTRTLPEQLTPPVIDRAAVLLQDLVRSGAPLGWVDPPSTSDVADLLGEVAVDVEAGDAALVMAWSGAHLAGLGFWRRYARPTHRPHADLEKVAVDPRRQGRGVGRALAVELVAAAVEAGVEVLTLDVRGDNERAVRLYESLGFSRYGMLRRFVAVRDARYDKVFMALDLRPPT